ncbi:bifunctional tRNA (5-methylaminomethyl-2-thiouridine)(34)-methyltransferase MnmD/FAD-dependent 5-carboxymethylaminomethyl-2-thiouridine(34) oxidoreductase MnmC [Marinomonas agarivorans]|nr:bifunctional tRNA (5-methylaminomethyl-2-thiouridine)(34)-methyltransferase MnmD/FAD-dependent 5-carboxymethylaminomethyl-2-thiouridine(34) oxidoreductase MnmC [Marinomonas agarivorans]
MLTTYRLAPATLNWDENGAPHSDQFNDVYFDREAGLEETRFVFLQHNQLEQRFTQLVSNTHSTHQKHAFTIAETGFGTGLNFLCSWQLWRQIQDKVDASQPMQVNKTRLHFISVEKYPLSKTQLEKALRMWPSLKPLADELLEVYPTLCKGLHRLQLDNNQVQLTLWFGDANEGFDSINADVDAWFLDGFAPSKNPDMWNDALFQHIKRLSHIDTSFATFTAAGIVKRGLQSVGFSVNKVKGFGKKREMLVGVLATQEQSFAQRATTGEAWFNNRPTSLPASTDSNILVVGAGLAGCHTARALAEKGLKVTLWEQHDQPAQEASGNPQGILYPKLASTDSPLNRFYLASYLYANSLLNRSLSFVEKTAGEETCIWQQTGLEQRPTSEAEQEKFAKLLANATYPDEVLTKSANHSNLDTSIWLPLSGWVKPAKWCQALIQHDNIHFAPHHRLSKLEQLPPQANSSDFLWQAFANNHTKIAKFSHVIFCSANYTDVLKQFVTLPTKPIRGQVSSVVLDKNISLDRVLCGNGYVSPPLLSQNQQELTLHFGSTYHIGDSTMTVTNKDHNENLAKLAELLPDTDWQTYQDQCEGRVSFRCTVSDYAPIIGPIPHVDSFVSNYKPLNKNAKWTSDNVISHLENLYVNLGHGSRGLISTPLAGEYIANLICHETSVYERCVEHVVHPARFLVRQLKRGKL